jgi:hypothetical protein
VYAPEQRKNETVELSRDNAPVLVHAAIPQLMIVVFLLVCRAFRSQALLPIMWHKL